MLKAESEKVNVECEKLNVERQMPVCEILLLIYFRRLQEIMIVEFKQMFF